MSVLSSSNGADLPLLESLHFGLDGCGEDSHTLRDDYAIFNPSFRMESKGWGWTGR